jgi:hypothetical protein
LLLGSHSANLAKFLCAIDNGKAHKL